MAIAAGPMGPHNFVGPRMKPGYYPRSGLRAPVYETDRVGL